MTEQDLQAIQAILKQELSPIKEDIRGMKEAIATMQEDITTMKESQEEVRDATNALLEWSDKVSASFQFPLPRL